MTEYDTDAGPVVVGSLAERPEGRKAMFGSWMTKLGAALVGLPPIIEALVPVLPPKLASILNGIGFALAALGIRRAIK